MIAIRNRVEWKLKSGAIASGIVQSINGTGIATLQVCRNGKPANAFVDLPIRILKRPQQLRNVGAEDLIAPQTSLQYGKPNDRQLNQIRALQPKGAADVTKESVTVVPIMVLNNLIHKNGWRLSIKALKTFVKIAPGIMCNKNHGRPGFCGHDLMVEDDWARVLGAKALENGTPTQKQIDGIGMREHNLAILEKEGFYEAIVTAYMPKDSDLERDMSLGLHPHVSVGQMFFEGVLCPLCGDAPFGEGDCDHVIPIYGKRTAKRLDIDEERVAPYWTFDQLLYVGEISDVVNPAVVGAGIVTG